MKKSELIMMSHLWDDVTTMCSKLFPMYHIAQSKVYEELWLALGHRFWANIGRDIKDELARYS